VKLIFSIFLFSLSLSFAEEILLDKIVAVINSRVISLSEVVRAKETIDARKEISPIIYSESSYDDRKLINILIQSTIIREKISAQGFVINDDAVESRIKMTEDRLGLKRSDLLNFLKTKNITFEEYFEIIRETMEYNIFSSKIISPLISVTEQEIKNEYYKMNSGNKALSFKYNLVDFYIKKSTLIDNDDAKFLNVLKDYQLTGRLPSEYKDLETNPLDNLSEDNLSKDLSSLLKTTEEGAFSKSIEINGYLHVFYVQKKDLVESLEFQKMKERIQNEIFSKKGQSVTQNWFDREYSNYYIKILL
jgi:peptidyl-prolyl cis-trans isomerase SurA